MQSLLHAGKGPFSPMVMQQQSLLGAPPGGRGIGMPMNPFLNAAVFNRGGVPQPRGIMKPHLANYKKPALAPLPNNGEISSNFIHYITLFDDGTY
jgi:hypothetical protein